MAVAVLGLARPGGCGEKDEPATTGPGRPADTTDDDRDHGTDVTATPVPVEGKPATLRGRRGPAFLSSPDAEAVCDEVLTAEFLRKAYGDRAGCVAARKPASLADPSAKVEVGPASTPAPSTAEPERRDLRRPRSCTITMIQEGKSS